VQQAIGDIPRGSSDQYVRHGVEMAGNMREGARMRCIREHYRIHPRAGHM
jgi:hypothetical protein